MKKKFILIISFVCFSQTVFSQAIFDNYEDYSQDYEDDSNSKTKGKVRITPKKMKNYFSKMVMDSFSIGKKIATLDSMKVLTATIPFYLIGRKVEDKIHKQFYNVATHTNRHQPSKALKVFLKDEVMALPFLGYSFLGWLHHDPIKRRAAQIFGSGLLIAWGSKIVVKEVIKTDGNLRPWCEGYSQHKRVHGGNPSGHTTLAAYMATYLGLYKGMKAGVPLGMYAGFIGGMSIAVNHHYLSQIIAGAGFGIAIGAASYSVFSDLKLPENLTVSFDMNQEAQLGLKIAYNF